jgi:putative ABC transport system permease protein
MRFQNILRLYRVRLRTRAVQELFAIVGIAVGVALLFSSQIASTSLDSSVQELVSGVVGNMRFELAARSPQGFDQRLLAEVQRLPGVAAVMPVLEDRTTIVGPRGQESIDLLSTDARFARLGGRLMRHFTAKQLEHQQAVALPLPIARAVGLSSLQPAELRVGARIVPTFIGAVLLEAEIGPLLHSAVAVTSIAYAQQLTDLPGRLTGIFVRPAAGREREVQTGLRRVAGGRLNVQPADFDATLFNQAAGPTDESAVLFSAISALVGFLFAFNAILLTVPQRRNLVEDLRLDGYARRMIIEVLLFDALVLGVVASLAGLLLGDLLSLALFRDNPGYLSFAFSLSSLRIITWQSLVLAAGAGLLAAFVGVLVPLRRDIFEPLSLGARPRWSGRGGIAYVLACGVACVALTTVILLVAPQDAIVGIVSLVVALLLLLPVLTHWIVEACAGLHRTISGAASYLAIVELKSKANQSRSLAIAATGAIAVFGSVAIQGAQSNLQAGLDQTAVDVNLVTDLWVSPAGVENTLGTTPFPDASSTLARLPGVRGVSVYRGGFLDVGDRRVWVLAPPRSSVRPVPPSQLVSGDLARATARIREHGWAVVSQAIAREHQLRIGRSFTLPAPRPTRFRVAALSTNIGWPPGAIIINADDYARAWASSEASAYNIALDPGVSPAAGRLEVERALGPRSGLVVQTARQREQQWKTTGHDGLSRLTQITALVLIAAILAMAATMGAMIWQRRLRLADMKVDGFGKGVLWRALLVESALLLGTGCCIGAAFGIYGQLLLSHALADVTGFPVVLSVGALVAVGSCVLVTTVAVLIVAIPGYLAVRVRPAIILQD